MTDKPATKSRKKPATRRKPQPAKQPVIVADEDTIKRAVQDLELNRPYYTCRVVGARLEFTMYGGDVIHWPPKPARKTRT